LKVLRASDYEDGVNLCFVYANKVICERAYINLQGFYDSRNEGSKVWKAVKKAFLGLISRYYLYL
jgi:hypothetical protein